MFGFNGRILRVNLSEKKITTEKERWDIVSFIRTLKK